MKKNNLYLLGALLVLGSACGKQDHYTLRGAFPGLEDGMVVTLSNTEAPEDDETRGLLASDTVRNGRFELRGSVASPVLCNLWISKVPAPGEKKVRRGVQFFLDNSDMEIQTPCFDSLYYISEFGPSSRELQTTVKGGALQEDFAAYRRAVYPADSAFHANRNALSSLNFDNMMYPGKYSPEEYTRLYSGHYAPMKEAAERLKQARLAFIRAHRQSPLSLRIAEEMLQTEFSVTEDELAELQTLTGDIADTVRQPRFAARARQARAYCKQAPYSNVRLYTTDYRQDSLSSYIHPGQVTLIDCWASWCGPCRAAIPQVEALYKQYGSDRLNVISISMDSKKEDWEKALKEENMPWTQLIAGNSGYDDLAGNYNIQSIPSLILIDGTGKVVCKTFSPEEIKIELEALFR